jgi:sporulation protein YlmC with PRC-barrel domain
MLKQLLVATAIATVAASAHAAPAADSATAPAGSAAAAPAVPADGLFLPQIDATDHLASRLMGVAVYDSDNANAQSIGKVNDLVLDDSGALDAVVVGVGGFLGIGEKNVGLSYSSLQWGTRDGSPVLIVATTKEALQDAPAVDVSALDQPAAAPAQTGMATPSPNSMTNQTAGIPLAQGAADEAANQAANGTADQMASQNPIGAEPTAGSAPGALPQTDVSSVSANDLVNTTVYSAKNENVGEVGDVIVGEDGKIDAVVLDVGGFLGIGEKPVAIAFDALDIRKDTNGNLVLYTRFTKDQLDAAPSYDKNTYAAQRETMRLSNPS